MSKMSKCCTCGYEWPTGSHGGHSCSEQLLKEQEKLIHALKMGVQLVDQILPQARHIVLDIGLTNEFLCAARPYMGK